MNKYAISYNSNLSALNLGSFANNLDGYIALALKAISEFNKGHLGKMFAEQTDSDYVGVEVFKTSINSYKAVIYRYDGLVICTGNVDRISIVSRGEFNRLK